MSEGHAAHVLRRVAVVAVLIGVAIALWAAPAWAHAALDSSDPPSGTRFPAGGPPAAVTLQFTEGVQIPDDAVRVFDAAGAEVAGVGKAGHTGGASTMTASLPELPDGGYVVTWRVVSSDSHPVDGSFTFTVGTGAAAGADIVAGLESHGDRALGIVFGINRALAFAGLLLLVGIVAFLVMSWPAAGDDPHVRTALWASWAAGLVTAIAGIGLQGAYSTGNGLGSAFDLSLAADVLDTRYGRASLARIALLLACIPFVRAPLRRATPGVRVLEAGLGVALLATLTAAGHAGTGRWIPLAIVTDLLHLGAAAVWLGGVTVLAIALSAGTRSPGVVRATARFSRIAAPAIAVIVVTGAIQALRQIEDVDSVLDSSYGRLVLTKIGLVVFIVAAASVSRYIVRRWTGFLPLPAGPGAAVAEADDQDVRDLRDALLVEVVIAGLVLACTAVLVYTEPARDATAASSAPAASEPFATTLESDGVSFEVSLDPTSVGANVLHVDVSVDGQPIQPIELTAELEEGTRGVAPLAVGLAPDPAGGYTGTADLPFAGSWELTIRALRTEIEEVVATTTIDVR